MPIFKAEQWAILNERDQLFCDYDTIEAVDNSASANVPTEPQEGGVLYAYDKVPQPSTVSVTLLFKGDYVKQNAAIDIINKANNSTERFTIVTPECVYENMTVNGYSESRTATANMNMLTVTVNFIEVRSGNLTNRTASYTPRNPTSATKVDEGRKQPSALASFFGL